MAKTVSVLKERMADEIAQRLKERSNLLVTSVERLTASDAGVLRKSLRSSDASLLLVKRRVSLRVLESLKVDGLDKLMEGSVALVFPADDVVPTAKLVVDFIKDHENQLTIRGALVDGQILTSQRVEELAKLPGRPVLLAQVIGMVEAGLSDIILCLEQLVGDIATLVERIAAAKPAETPPKAKEEPAAPAAPAAPETPAPSAPAASGTESSPPETPPDEPPAAAPTEEAPNEEPLKSEPDQPPSEEGTKS